MIAVTAGQVSPALLALFNLAAPTMPRAFNVLEGRARGQIMVDDPARPSWAAVCGASYGTLYFGGKIDAPLVVRLLAHFRRIRDVGLGCWPNEPLNEMALPNPDYDGATLYFTQRSPEVALPELIGQLPAGYSLMPRDAQLLAQSFDYEATLAAFGTLERVLDLTFGVAVIHNGSVVCEAATGAATHGRIEVGVTTAEDHRGRGLATAACGSLIALCEGRGYAIWWDCAKQNVASARLAHKLGYQNGREYRYRWWAKHSP